eukprot:SAG31_NODE_22032_length_535_cov_1.045872_1_plen_23_part_10
MPVAWQLIVSSLQDKIAITTEIV